MKQTRRLLAAALVMTPAIAAAQWLDPVPEAAGRPSSWAAIKPESFTEVAASRLAAAEQRLAEKPFASIDHAKRYGRVDFTCSEQAKLYIVRAEYANGGNGMFRLYRWNAALIVAHASLGRSSTPTRTVLMACLESEPEAVYGQISVVM